MDCHGFLWNAMGPYGSQWDPVDANGFCVSNCFKGPLTVREGAETLDPDHLDTLFLRRSVHFFILGNF